MPNSVNYDQRLRHLLSTAARVFAAKGFHSTTMRDLSREAAMSLAGMYYYVHSKDELLFLIQERCFSSVLAGAGRAVAQGTDPIDRLDRFIHHHVKFFAQHMDEMKVLSHDADSLSVERQAVVNGLKRRYVDQLLGLLTDVKTLGGDFDPPLAAYALFGMMNWIYTWYDPAGAVAPDALATQLAGIFLRGVAPTPTTASHDS